MASATATTETAMETACETAGTRAPTTRIDADPAEANERAPAAALHAVCLHEYAHLAAARHFGATGFVRICRTDAGWLGRFQLHGALDDDQWRIVALAGAVAELLAQDASLGAECLKARLASDSALLAGVDLELARGYAIEDVTRCRAIVARAWRDIASDATERADAVSP